MAGAAFVLLGLVSWFVSRQIKDNTQIREMAGSFSLVTMGLGGWLSAGAWIAPRKAGWWMMAACFATVLVTMAFLPALLKTPMGVMIVLFSLPTLFWCVAQARKA
ncbi:hypothetical protein BH11ARM2_BH11ARM2_13160 [soil metagenome]